MLHNVEPCVRSLRDGPLFFWGEGGRKMRNFADQKKLFANVICKIFLVLTSIDKYSTDVLKLGMTGMVEVTGSSMLLPYHKLGGSQFFCFYY